MLYEYFLGPIKLQFGWNDGVKHAKANDNEQQ